MPIYIGGGDGESKMVMRYVYERNTGRLVGEYNGDKILLSTLIEFADVDVEFEKRK